MLACQSNTGKNLKLHTGKHQTWLWYGGNLTCNSLLHMYLRGMDNFHIIVSWASRVLLFLTNKNSFAKKFLQSIVVTNPCCTSGHHQKPKISFWTQKKQNIRGWCPPLKKISYFHWYPCDCCRLQMKVLLCHDAEFTNQLRCFVGADGYWQQRWSLEKCTIFSSLLQQNLWLTLYLKYLFCCPQFPNGTLNVMYKEAINKFWRYLWGILAKKKYHIKSTPN